MNQKQVLRKHVLSYGIVLGITLSVVELLAFFMGMLFSPIVSNIFLIIVMLSVLLAVKKYRDTEMTGFISFGEAFLVGLFICIIAGIIWAIYRFVQYSLAPYLVEEILYQNLESFKNSQMDKQFIEQIEKASKLFITPIFLAVQTLVVNMTFGGSLLSLFIASLLRRIKPIQ